MRLLALLALLPLLTAFGPPALVESYEARSRVTEPVVERLAAFKPPPVRSRAAVLVDQATGEALLQRNADQPIAMASTTKIMTALLASEQPLDRTVRVQVGAAQLPGHSVAGLRQGEQLPLGEALYALLLPSGNDAALAVASSLAGSTDAFVAQMNRRAEQMGLGETRFANPHGFDAPGHHSSARDLARLTRAALGQAVVARVVATREHAFGGHSWTNTNRLLSLRPDATGVKTGTSDAAGAALVASARRGERAGIVVLLGSPDRWAEADALLDHFFRDYAVVSTPRPSPFRRGPTTPTTVPAWQASFDRP
jgi:D-alanyl-D-alanine carboxypeptidase (penicillin-binding protein 5/6)